MGALACEYSYNNGVRTESYRGDVHVRFIFQILLPKVKINNSEPSRLRVLDKRNVCTKFQLLPSGINIENACYTFFRIGTGHLYPGVRHDVRNGVVQPGLTLVI